MTTRTRDRLAMAGWLLWLAFMIAWTASSALVDHIEWGIPG